MAALVLSGSTRPSMRIVHLVVFAVCGLLGIALLGHKTHSQTAGYSIEDLGTFGGDTSSANAINNKGDVVGQADTNTLCSHAFFWSHGKMRDLSGLPDPFTKEPGASTETNAASINDRGDIVGDADTGYGSTDGEPRGIYHAVLWQSGQISDLGAMGGYQDSTAVKIDAAGLVLGRAILQENVTTTHSYKDQAFFSQGSKVWPVGFKALDINAQGQTVGWRRRGGKDFVVILDHQHVHELGQIPAGFFVKNLVISNSGAVAATWSRWNGENDPSGYGLFPCQAVLWQSNRWQNLVGLPSQPESDVSGMNSSGAIVGQSLTAPISAGAVSQSASAVLWQNNRVVDLNRAIPSDLGWNLINATSINERGQIVGFGTINGHNHAFLMTPNLRFANLPNPPAKR